MATYSEATIQQGTYEIRKWTVDFTNDLPSAVTVASGTAVHTPPSGTASALTIAATNPYVTVQLGALSVTGVHYLDVVATLSNGEVSQVRITFVVNYPATTARAGMADLLDTLRGFTDAGVNDYVIAGVPYWSDAQLQKVCDRHRTKIVREELTPFEDYEGAGTIVYKEYRSAFGNIESGTAVFKIETGPGALAPTYSGDYLGGVFTFSADQAGTAYFMTGYSYDIYAAAADIWHMKADSASSGVDFRTDNMSVNRSQMIKNFQSRAEYYERMMGAKVYNFTRDDSTILGDY